MGKYIVKTLISAIPTLLGVVTCVFLIVRLIPGDPAVLILGDNASQEQILALRQEIGLDQPIHIQYVRYLVQIGKGDFGVSLRTERKVIDEILAVFPYTVELTVAAILISVLIGVPIGVISAKKRNTVIDYFAMTFAMVGVSMPVFWLGILLILSLSLTLGWFPTIGGGEAGNFFSRMYHLILPATALGAGASAITARMTRTSMLEILQQDYIRTARAKGLSEFNVLAKHALRNTLIPVITVVGLNMGRLLGGGIVTEVVFARPGMGKLLIDAIYARDYPQVQGVIAFFAMMVILVNLLVDLSYSMVDPRVKLS